MAVKNLIFDIGHVLVSYRGRELLGDRGMDEVHLADFNRKVFEDPLWAEFDYENIPYEEVVDRYARKYPEYDEEIRWLFSHAYLMPIHRPRVWEKLHELKRAGYGIYILSNYSSTLLQMHLHGLPFWDDVDGQVVSYEVHEVKPHPEIYQALMDKYGLKKEECAFFDDRQDNVDGGERFGIRSYLVTGEDQLIGMMQQFLRDRLLPQAIAYEEKHEHDVPESQRPLFHLSSRVGWMNDPNGFSYYQGQYHLFYQYYPYESVWGPMHWAHAVSSDLLHWQHLPAAIAPDQSYDQDGCFSGSAIELPDGRQLLMYTAVDRTGPDVRTGEEKTGSIVASPGDAAVWYMARRPDAQIDRQTQALAVGDGVTYEKYVGNPVLDDTDLPAGASIADFRDPKMVRLADGTYRCYCVTNIPGRGGALVQYQSDNGFDWSYKSTMAVNDGRIGRMWECPDFFEMDGRYLLLASAQDMLEDGEFHSGNGAFLMAGSYDDETGIFTAEELRNVDYGPDFYAEQTVLAPDGRRIMIGWMQNWDTVNLRTDPHQWYGQMSVPREIFFKDGVFCQRPLRELKEMCREKAELSGVILADEERSFDGIEGRTLWLDVDIDVSSNAGSDIDTGVDGDVDSAVGAGEKALAAHFLRQFGIRFACDEHFHTDLQYDVEDGTIRVDRRFSGTRRAAVHSGQTQVSPQEGRLHLTIILDRYSAEIFVGDGEKTLTITMPTDLSAQGIRFFAKGAVRMDIHAWEIVR